MRKFIIKILFFLSPILIIAISIEILLRNIPNDYSYKNNYLEENADNLETLFLGSSHSYYGINPQYCTGNSFNASHISQTIDLDFQLLKKYSSDLKNLKFLVIPIDYFTLYSRTSTDVESWRMKNYHIYYNLKTSLNPIDYFELFSFNLNQNYKRISEYYFRNKNNLTCSKLGYGNIIEKQADLIESGKIAAARHTIYDEKYINESIEIINDFIYYAEENNILILFYTSPAYITYRANLNSTQLNFTIKTIDSICNNHKNSVYINLLDDERFLKDDFRDADHLNRNGAIKLTTIIDAKIKKVKHESTTTVKGE